MKRLFGTKKEKPPAPSLTNAATGVGSRVDALDDRIKKLDLELRGYKEKLKTTKGNSKALVQKRAMACLKKKRAYENQRDQLAGQQFNIEQADFAIESAKDTVTTVAAMKAANTQLKKQYKEFNIDEIEDITDDMADMMEDMNEINEAMGRTYGVPDDVDEADLEAELDLLGEELEAEEFEAESATPAYLQPQNLPVEPEGGVGEKGEEQKDEFGLPVAPQMG